MGRSIHFIGECRLNITVNSDVSAATISPGGNMLNAAIKLGQGGIPTCFIGEAATDPFGSAIVDTLANNGVDTGCIDRYPDGATTINLLPAGDTQRPDGVFYTKWPAERLVLKWPRISQGDIVVFGNWFALNHRTGGAVAEFVQYAASRNAMIVYLPGFAIQLQPAITHVMPAILDYLELANLVVTFNSDCHTIFQSQSAADCYRRRINFYCSSMVNISGKGVEIFTSPESVDRQLPPDETADDATLLASLLTHLANVDADTAPDPTTLAKQIKTWRVNH